MRALRVSILVAAVALVAAPLAGAADKDTGRNDSGGIEWFGTWEGGLAAAKKTGKPILLIAAAPHCKSISGIW